MSDRDARKSGEEGMKAFYICFLALGLIIGVIIGIAIGGFVLPQSQIHGSISANVLTPEEAGETAVAFISTYAVPPGVNVTLVNVTEVGNANLYKVAINLSMLGTSETRELYITKDGELLFPGAINIEEFEEMAEVQKEQEERQVQKPKQETTIGNFVLSGDEICTENGKPIIYFFGNDRCGACKWEHPIVENVTSKFDGYISFHDNMNTAGADGEVFSKYSPGSIPTLVLGCNYYRVGAGVAIGEDQEAKVLTALICKLTDNKPAEVCNDPEIEALINQIE
jgi:thiol-disulfide isomerase/thioredoxin